MKFDYQARDEKGEQQKGVVEASSREAALQILDRQGLYVTFLQEEGTKPIYSRKIVLFGRVSMKDVLLFSRQLSIMFKARVSLVEALATIGQQIKNKVFREKILQLSEEVEGGTAFSQALSRHPDVFSSFYVQMVRRGEALGKLSDVLEYLAEHLEREYFLKSKVKGALIYPLFVLSIAGVVLTLMIMFVVPNLTAVLQESGQDLPPITEVVIAFSKFYRQWWWVVTVMMIGVVAGIVRFLKTKQGRKFFHPLFLRIPVLGSLLQMVYITRFGENLSTLISGGVPIVEALEITGKIVGNELYEHIIEEAKDEVGQGSHIADALQKYPAQFSPVFTQMVRVGEKSGRLDITLMDIVRFYQKEVDRNIETFLSLLEPLMIVILGLVVGGLMISIVLPMYQITSSFAE